MKHNFARYLPFLIRVLSILSLAYFSLVLFVWLYSDSLIFFPQKNNYVWSDELISIPSIDANDNARSHKIVARYLVNPEARYTLLYSHGNAVDISGLIQLQQKFYNHGYSIIVYDYSGYGLSEGEPSERQLYNDVQAVYQQLIDQYQLLPENIISYGHSLGAAVAVDLAYKKPVAALVIESPFLSAFRVKTAIQLVPFDKFVSIDKIDQVHAPLLVMHSRDDPVVPFWHGEKLFEKARPLKQKIWFNKAGHSAITHDNSLWTEFNLFINRIAILRDVS